MDKESIRTLKEQARSAKDASRVLYTASSEQRNAALLYVAELIRSGTEQILDANRSDMKEAEDRGLPKAQLDRLRLTDSRVAQMADGVLSVAALPDVVGRVRDGWVRPNGLRISRVSVPLGVIGIIYENRPNVTSDAASLCLKSGNAVMLRGSAAAFCSNSVISDLIRQGLVKADLPVDAVSMVGDTSRESAVEFMRLRGFVDCLIPRGGKSLIRSIEDNATVPYILDGDGNCHIYVDRTADLEMALSILENAKCQRPGVCNSAETLLVHVDVAERFLTRVGEELSEVEIRGCDRTRQVLPLAKVATEEDYETEFLDLILSVKVVDSIDEAIDHIASYGSGHSEAIVTSELLMADYFKKKVDAAAVLVNASTRFVDGGEVGFGAEIGISTQKLHARGPMGLEQLTTLKFIIEGEGQIR